MTYLAAHHDFVTSAGAALRLLRQAILAYGTLVTLAAPVGAQGLPSANPGGPVQPTAHWDKTFPRSQKVDQQKVSFKNRYGITLVADLYLPKDRAAGGLPRLRSMVPSVP